MKIEIDTSEAVEEVKKLREETDLLIQSLEKAIGLVDQIEGKDRITSLPGAASIKS